MGTATLPKITIDMNKLEDFEIGARFTALLAYPQLRETERREKTANAICANIVDATIKTCPAEARKMRKLYPQYRVRNNRASIDIIKRLESCTHAGVTILCYLKASKTGQPFKHPWQGHRLSQHDIAKFLQRQDEDEDDDQYFDRLEMFEKRTIRKWRPIWHIAAAFAFVARQVEGNQFIFEDIDFFRKLVAQANEFEPDIRAHPRLETCNPELVSLEWIERCTDSCP